MDDGCIHFWVDWASIFYCAKCNAVREIEDEKPPTQDPEDVIKNYNRAMKGIL